MRTTARYVTTLLALLSPPARGDDEPLDQVFKCSTTSEQQSKLEDIDTKEVLKRWSDKPHRGLVITYEPSERQGGYSLRVEIRGLEPTTYVSALPHSRMANFMFPAGVAPPGELGGFAGGMNENGTYTSMLILDTRKGVVRFLNRGLHNSAPLLLSIEWTARCRLVRPASGRSHRTHGNDATVH